MTDRNKIVIAAAGSGKTTFLVREALAIKDERVLITTYTESNEAEIRSKFFELHGHLPANVVIMTWFSLLITHGVKPFQAPLITFTVKGMELVQSASAVKYTTKQGISVRWAEGDNFRHHYFNSNSQIYSDKVSKLVLRCDREADGSVFERLQRVFPNIFIDEVQDLAGYDLDVILSLFAGKGRVLLVGDPRQVTYLTHNESRHGKYADGRVVDFLTEKMPKKIKWQLDDTTLSRSHRNSQIICEFSSKLYPTFSATSACECDNCRPASSVPPGLFIVKHQDVRQYLIASNAVQLRDDVNQKDIVTGFRAMNFGISKGRGYDHVLIFPTQPMLKWLRNPTETLAAKSRAKLYVALTRARHSVGVVANDDASFFHGGFQQYIPLK